MLSGSTGPLKCLLSLYDKYVASECESYVRPIAYITDLSLASLSTYLSVRPSGYLLLLWRSSPYRGLASSYEVS
jgi:hypothetical protein